MTQVADFIGEILIKLIEFDLFFGGLDLMYGFTFYINQII